MLNNPSEKLEKIINILIEYIFEGKIRNERIFETLCFLLEFQYDNVVEFIVTSIRTNNFAFQRFEKNIIKYIQNNWEYLREKIVNVAFTSVDHIKLLYILLKKLKAP